MSACQHAPLSGAALMAICDACGAAYDVAPPRHIGRPQRAQRSKRRQATDVIDMTADVFNRPSVMTPLAKPRKPRAARPSLEKECRAEYDRYIMAMFDKAQLECNEFLSNEARAAGCKYSAWELFTHRKTVIARWASEELITFFCFNRRLSYAQFRQQWREGQGVNQTEQDVA
jgi:hypothetical protein